MIESLYSMSKALNLIYSIENLLIDDWLIKTKWKSVTFKLSIAMWHWKIFVFQILSPPYLKLAQNHPFLILLMNSTFWCFLERVIEYCVNILEVFHILWKNLVAIIQSRTLFAVAVWYNRRKMVFSLSRSSNLWTSRSLMWDALLYTVNTSCFYCLMNKTALTYGGVKYS